MSEESFQFLTIYFYAYTLFRFNLQTVFTLRIFILFDLFRNEPLIVHSYLNDVII
jgi:hypothetical protein